jgi:hypothetical protein
MPAERAAGDGEVVPGSRRAHGDRDCLYDRVQASPEFLQFVTEEVWGEAGEADLRLGKI